jgi:competence protein ComEC
MAAVSAAAQAAVFPLALNAFPETGLWFPLNILWLPALGFWVMPLSFAGLFAAVAGFSGAAPHLFSLAELPCEALLALLRAMDGAGALIAPASLRPAWPAMAGFWLLLLLAPAVFPARAFSRRTLLLLAAGMALATGPSLAAALMEREELVRLQLLDVGQGQSALISWQGKSGKGRALIDGGGFASGGFDVGRRIIAPALTDNAAPDIDWLVNSHPDADHLQGLLFPLAAFRVANMAVGPEPDRKKTETAARRDAILRRRGIRPVVWRAGDRIPLADGLVLEVLNPGAEAGDSANDASLALRLVKEGKALALICGDMERRSIRKMLGRNAPLEAEVLVVPHHGSAGSVEPKLYDAVRPKLALAACGYANAWRHPSRALREELARRSIPFATTAGKGQICVTWKGRDMIVEYAR